VYPKREYSFTTHIKQLTRGKNMHVTPSTATTNILQCARPCKSNATFSVVSNTQTTKKGRMFAHKAEQDIGLGNPTANLQASEGVLGGQDVT